jgi:hypothetical protein
VSQWRFRQVQARLPYLQLVLPLRQLELLRCRPLSAPDREPAWSRRPHPQVPEQALRHR